MGWWKKYSCYLLIALAIVVVLYIVFVAKKDYKGGYMGIDLESLKNLFKKKKKQKKKHESRCRAIFEKIYKASFTSVRPDFLRYKNGKNLELDGYNRELKIAFEYQGRQHYEFVPYFHKNKKAFEEQKERDIFKSNKCKELGIELVEIPDTVKMNDLDVYIMNELIDRNLHP